MPRTMLIVGCGYLGEYLLRYARAAGWQVAATSRSPERRMLLQQRGAAAWPCEVTDPQTLAGLPAADVVVYAVSLSSRGAAEEQNAWLLGLRYFMDCWQLEPARWRRFILVSSTSVYGQKDESWVRETDATEPESPAGRMLLAGEAEVQRARAWNGEVVAARLSGIYGPGRIVYYRQFCQQLPLQAEPNGWLNLIHVEDAARALLAIADTQRPDLVYNITDDEPVRRWDYWQALSQWLGLPIPPVVSRPIDSAANRRISNGKLKRELGWDLLYPSYRKGVPRSLEAMTATATGL